jgi:hypothetical protein
MGIMAMGTQKISLGAIPVSSAAAMNAGAPIAILFAVALAAYPVRFFERHPFTAGQMQNIAIIRIMAIEAPAMRFVVLQNDIAMHRG